VLSKDAFEDQVVFRVKITFHDVLFLYFVRKDTHLKLKNGRKRLKIATGRFIFNRFFRLWQAFRDKKFTLCYTTDILRVASYRVS
jgi:hypothetical protein